MSTTSTKQSGAQGSPPAPAGLPGGAGTHAHPGSAPIAPPAAAAHDHASPPSARTDGAVVVLVSSGARRPPDVFDCGLLGSRRETGRVYRIEPIALDRLADVEGACRARAPRVLLVDAHFVRDAGPGAVRQLRRQFPAVDWLLGWDAAHAVDFDVALLSQVRGGVHWTVDAEGLVRALDAVTAGNLWFPRTLLESLYLALLDADAPDAPAKPVIQLAPVLTAREGEVRSLMRHGMTNRQIALQLGVSVNTVKKHLAHVFEKRGLHCRRQDFL